MVGRQKIRTEHKKANRSKNSNIDDRLRCLFRYCFNVSGFLIKSSSAKVDKC